VAQMQPRHEESSPHQILNSAYSGLAKTPTCIDRTDRGLAGLASQVVVRQQRKLALL